MRSSRLMSSNASGTQALVLRNALILVVAQALTTPLSVLVNAVMGRYIGAQDFGHFYLATTYVSLAFLFVEWGTAGTLPAKIAKDRSRAGEFLGTGILWRGLAAVVVGALLVVGSVVLRSAHEFRVALVLMILIAILNTGGSAFQDTMRGFERTDIAAYSAVGLQFLVVLLVIPTLLLGGRLRETLMAHLVAGAVVLTLVWRTVRRANVGALSFRPQTLKTLLHDGSPFLFFGVSMALQPNVDAAFLSWLAPVEAVGWLAAARRLVGVLVYPANALITALYPTLCRLYADDREGYQRTVRNGLRIAAMLAVPLAMGCALYPDIGIRIFSRKQFGPAEDDLRILSIFVALVYFSMVLGVALLAAERARLWAMVQFLCVIVSAALDPILVPWFQTRFGNGGLGVCVSNVGSEVLMTGAGIWLTPRGVFDRPLRRQLLLALVAAGAMAAVARLLSGFSSFIAAPFALSTYAVCLWATGGLDKEQVEVVRSIVARKFSRRTS